MAIICSAPDSTPASATTSHRDALSHTSSGQEGRNQTGGNVIGRYSSRFHKAAGSMLDGEFSSVVRHPEGIAFGRTRSTIHAVGKWQNGTRLPLARCQTGS